MLKGIWDRILSIFGIKTSTTNKEYYDNDYYAKNYESIRNINFTSIFSNKLANYVCNDSQITIDENNKRAELLKNILKNVDDRKKRIVSRAFGLGGVVLVPRVQNGEIDFDLVPQNRLSINEKVGNKIKKATILADVYNEKSYFDIKTYFRWTDYSIENNNLYIRQRYTDKDGQKIDKPIYWEDVEDEIMMPNVDRVPFGYFKSPVDNRRTSDNYGVPITYGCEETIEEIRECLMQIKREFKLKECFVGADSTMFDGKNALPKDGIFRKVDAGEDNFFEVFDPAIRESSYYTRLQELYKRLEHEIGTSYGILSDVQTQNATATEIKRSLYDTFTIVDDMRRNFEKGLEDFLYACDILANYYSLTPMGEYNVSYSWSYTLLEDSQQEFSQLVQGINNGVVAKEELRQWLFPNEDIEESKKIIAEIESKQVQEEPFME